MTPEERKIYNAAYRKRTKAPFVKLTEEEKKSRASERSKARYLKNKDRLCEANAVYRAANKEKIAEKRAVYYERNKEAIFEYQRKYQQGNKDLINQRSRAYRQRRRDYFAARDAIRKAAELRAIPAWADRRVINVLYEQRALVSAETGVEWHVDHIVPLRSKLVCGLHCEQNLRLLPASENAKKSNLFWPDMPERETC